MSALGGSGRAASKEGVWPVPAEHFGRDGLLPTSFSAAQPGHRELRREENRAVVGKSIAMLGTYSVNLAEETL